MKADTGRRDVVLSRGHFMGLPAVSGARSLRREERERDQVCRDWPGRAVLHVKNVAAANGVRPR